MPRKTYRKVITLPEIKSQINVKNLRLVDRFLKNFDIRRSDKSTVVYRSNFNIFFCWNVLENDNKFFINIRKADYIDFFDYAVSELKWSPNRYAQMWSSLNSLSNFVENYLDDDYPLFRNQVKKIEKLPKNLVREKTVLSEKQIEKLLNNLVEDNRLQEACFLSLAISSGARVSELFRFRTDIIDESSTAFDGLFYETKEMIKTKGFGKQGSMKYKYIIKGLFKPYYDKWLPLREEIMNKNNQTHSFIFIKSDGAPADKDITDNWLRKWEKFLDEDKETNPNQKDIHIYPHCLRHYCCTYLSKIGLEMELIVELFGWANGGSAMYSIYNDNTAKDRTWKSLNKLKLVMESLNENN